MNQHRATRNILQFHHQLSIEELEELQSSMGEDETPVEIKELIKEHKKELDKLESM